MCAVEFVLFTQPKTATHLLIPILKELTDKNCYWAPNYSQNVDLLAETIEEALENPENYLFSLQYAPWKRSTIDHVWSINQKQNTFLHLHAPYSLAMENYLKEKQCVNFFIKRDPRDQIISLLNHYKYIQPSNDCTLTDDEKLLMLIKNESRRQTIHYMNWLNSPICCVLDFEKLMGRHGGKATLCDALKEVKKIAEALKLDYSDKKLQQTYQRSFGHSWSFFRGKVGVWKEYFREEHILAIKEEIGDLLIQLGYEKDLEW